MPSASSLAGRVLLFGGDEQDGAQQEPNGNFRRTKLFDIATRTIVADFNLSPDSDVFARVTRF